MKKYCGHPRFYDLLKEMAELHSKKNSDYAKIKDPLANLRRCKELGVSPFIGCLVRLSDKFSRLEGFARKGFLEVKDESIKDTLMDTAVYSLLAIILKEEENAKSVRPVKIRNKK
jgi:hypothetical protein